MWLPRFYGLTLKDSSATKSQECSRVGTVDTSHLTHGSRSGETRVNEQGTEENGEQGSFEKKGVSPRVQLFNIELNSDLFIKRTGLIKGKIQNCTYNTGENFLKVFIVRPSKHVTLF